MDQEQKSIESSCNMEGGKTDPILQSCVTVKTSQVLWKASCLVDPAPLDLSYGLVAPEADVEELWNFSDRSEGQQNKRMWTAPWSRWAASPNPHFLYVLNTFRST